MLFNIWIVVSIYLWKKQDNSCLYLTVKKNSRCSVLDQLITHKKKWVIGIGLKKTWWCNPNLAECEGRVESLADVEQEARSYPAGTSLRITPGLTPRAATGPADPPFCADATPLISPPRKSSTQKKPDLKNKCKVKSPCSVFNTPPPPPLCFSSPRSKEQM